MRHKCSDAHVVGAFKVTIEKSSLTRIPHDSVIEWMDSQVHPMLSKSANVVDDAALFGICAGLSLRYYRLSRGFSQEKLAEKTGITFQQIQKYEKSV